MKWILLFVFLTVIGFEPACAEVWSEKALASARAANRPVLLTIESAICHGCRAELAQTGGVTAISLDPERHPYVAAAYRTYAAGLGQHELPIVLILTPQLEPLAAVDADNVPRFMSDFLARWNADAATVTSEAGLVMRRMLIEKNAEDGVTRLEDVPALQARAIIANPPSTPAGRAIAADFLLRLGSDDDRRIALEMLRRQARSGSYDHIGGGVFRAARDAPEVMPFFEKRLRDQALIAMAYTEAWQVSGDPLFEQIARETLDAILRDFKEPRSSLFVVAFAADSFVPRAGPELADGGHYVWTAAEIRRLLAARVADVFMFHYGVTTAGNLPTEHAANPDFRGANVPRVAHSDSETQRRFGLSGAELADILRQARSLLLLVRSKRPAPAWDRTVTTDANSLAISALARAGAALDDPRYVDAAGSAMRELTRVHFDAKTGTLLRTAGVPATAADYAAFVQALLDVYEVTFEPDFLERAFALQERQNASLWDDRAGRYTMGKGVPEAVAPLLEETDEEHPSANAMSLMNLIRLSSIAGSGPFRTRASSIARAWTKRSPSMASAILLLQTPPKQVVVAGGKRPEETWEMIRVLRQPFRPRRMLFLIDRPARRSRLAVFMPQIADIQPINEHPVATVCRAGTCRTPTLEVARALTWIDQP